MTENSMMPCSGERCAVKGSRMAASVSILTPGIAPNSMPPTTPPKKISMPIGSLNSVIVPVRKLSNASTFCFPRFLLQHGYDPTTDIVEGMHVADRQTHVKNFHEQQQ